MITNKQIDAEPETMILNNTTPKKRGRPKGSKNKIKKQSDKKAQKISSVEQRKSLCYCCGKQMSICNFYRSHSEVHAGNEYLLPTCKKCLERLYRKLKSEYTKEIKKVRLDVDEFYIEKKVIKRLCMMNDIYYDDSLFKAALKQSSSHTMLSAYMKIANLIQYQKRTYDDTFKDDVINVTSKNNK